MDATIIAAPSSNKNADRARALEMHQTKKGNQWSFGMKVHMGGQQSGLVYSASVTPANVHDSQERSGYCMAKRNWLPKIGACSAYS